VQDGFGELEMAIGDIPILSMLRTRLDWAQARQRLLAENVANADTPKFQARDLAPLKLDDAPLATPNTVATVSLARTDSSHIEGVGLSEIPYRDGKAPTFEVRPTGNAVNLEEEMMKVAANNMDFQTATALYTRSLNLIKTALGKR
jgi:flagellar basal-body rod protein FlgB